ncbi:MAG: OmpA family protein [Pseudomonadales bacterium]|jgi:OOP family OmpA-OmpF porin
MSLRTQISSALLVWVGLISSAVLADEGEFYVAPGLQWMDFDDTTGLREDVNYFLGIGYDFTDRLSFELSTFDLDTKVSGGPEIDIDHYKLDLIYDLGVNLGAFDTFVLGGVGNSNFGGENDTLWDIGGGVSYKISDNWSWRTTVRSFQYIGRDHEDLDVGIDTALVYRFGGNKSRPAVVRTATSAAPTADPDTDRDGVLDSRDNCPDTLISYAVDTDGCPISVEEVARVELMVNFDFDRSDVKSEYFSEIEDVADFMARFPDVDIELEGHTDSRGTQAYNLGLSNRRVAAVRQVMIDRFNVQASRVSSRGYGESQPVASNDFDAGRAENRRVMTVVINTVDSYRPR